MAVNITAGSRFQFGVPKALFDAPVARNSLNSFDLSKDGRFLLPALAEPRVAAPMTVVLNWPALLRRGH